MNTHERAEKLFEDGDWALMKGPIPWFMNQHRYFLHHTCTELANNGDQFWQTWFDPDDRGTRPWCPRCDSEPPRNLIGLFRAMTWL